MLEIPEVDGVSAVWGDIKHMPKYDALPEEFRRERSPYCRAVSMWFFKGCSLADNVLTIDEVNYRPREGVDSVKALRAIKAALSSFEPKHEHKIAACGFMLSQWFEKQ